MRNAERRMDDVAQTLDRRRPAEPVPAEFARLLRDWPAWLMRPRKWDAAAIGSPRRRCAPEVINRVKAECRALGRWLKGRPQTSMCDLFERLPDVALDGLLFLERIRELTAASLAVDGAAGNATIDGAVAGEKLRVTLPVNPRPGSVGAIKAALAPFVGSAGRLVLPTVDGMPELAWVYDPERGDALRADVVVDGKSLSAALVEARLAEPETGVEIS